MGANHCRGDAMNPSDLLLICLGAAFIGTVLYMAIEK